MLDSVIPCDHRYYSTFERLSGMFKKFLCFIGFHKIEVEPLIRNEPFPLIEHCLRCNKTFLGHW